MANNTIIRKAIYFNPYVTYGGADDYDPSSSGSYTVTTTSYYCDGSTTGTTNTYTIPTSGAASPIYYGQQNITLAGTDSSGSPLSYFQIDINLSNAVLEFYGEPPAADIIFYDDMWADYSEGGDFADEETAQAAESAAQAAQTEATSAANNTTNDPTADSAITNATTEVAATNTAVGTINTDTAQVSGHTAAYWAQANNTTLGTVNTNTAATNTTVGTINTDTAYNPGTGSQSAAYWAYQADQAATAASSNVTPVVNSITGQNGATCTSGSTFVADVNGSNISNTGYTYTGTVSPSGPTASYSPSAETITVSGISSTTQAYTISFTAKNGSYTGSGTLTFFET